MPSCTARILLVALHSYLSPQTAHHHAVFCRRYPPNIVLQKKNSCNCGQTNDKVTLPIPPTGAMIRLRKSVLFLKISSAIPKRPASSFTIFSYASRIVARAHSDDFPLTLFSSCHLVRKSGSRPRAKPFHTKVRPTTLAPYLDPLGRRSLKPRFHKSCGPTISLDTDYSPRTSKLCPKPWLGLEIFFPQLQSFSVAFPKCLLCRLSHKINLPLPSLHRDRARWLPS